MNTQKCFVAMPISSEGSEEHEHFRAIYEQAIKPTLIRLGYEVVRADKIQKTGAITRDIVLALANADVVIVDLTDLNPNVFYELGVRHALRARGTIMILDELRTDKIPFDLGAYRVIQFKGNLPGINKLVEQLESFIDELKKNDISHRDNPVHDWIPSLPPDAIGTSKDSVEGELREKLARAEQKIKKYEQAYGKETSSSDEKDPLSIIMGLLSEAAEGNMPSDLLKKAEVATRERNVKDFLTIVRRVVERGTRLSDTDFDRLATYAINLGLADIAGAIYDHALQMHPKSHTLRKEQLFYSAHSQDPALRARARQEILNEIGIKLEDNKIIMCPKLSKAAAKQLGVALDAFHEDDLNEQALEITQAAITQNPDNSVVLRNHARALKFVNRVDEAMTYYQKAILSPEADDASMMWFGSDLHNRDRHVDAAEVYLLACLADPEDASGFANLADEIAWAMREQQKIIAPKGLRRLPQLVTTQTGEMALNAASSCRLKNYKDVNLMQSVAERLNLDFQKIVETPLTVSDRIDFASKLYKEFESEITNPSLKQSMK